MSDPRESDWRKQPHNGTTTQLTEQDVEYIRIQEGSGFPAASSQVQGAFDAMVAAMTDAERVAYQEFRAAARDLRAAQENQQAAAKRFMEATNRLSKVAAPGKDAE